VFDQPLGLLNYHFGDLHMAGGRFVEGAGDDLGAYRALHFRDFLGTLVDQQHDQVAVRMIGCDRLCQALQQHGLAGLRRRNDEPTLTLADRRDQIDDARRQVLGAAVATLQRQALVGEQRCQVLEQYLVLGVLRRLEIDLADLQQGEIALALLWRADRAVDRVAGAKIEAADLAGRDIDVVGSGEIGAVCGAQEAEAVLEYLEHTIAPDLVAFLRLRLQQTKDDVLLARARSAFNSQSFCKADQFGCGFAFEFREIHVWSGCLRKRACVAVPARVRLTWNLNWKVCRNRRGTATSVIRNLARHRPFVQSRVQTFLRCQLHNGWN
jgi:hypothetical protein